MMSEQLVNAFVYLLSINYVLLHESDISQLSSESFNQLIDMTSELFVLILKPRINNNFPNYATKQLIRIFT